MSDEGDPFDPKRWTARGGQGGPITGDELALLKDLVARRMGVGNWDPEYERSLEPQPVPSPAPRRGWWARLRSALRRRR